MGNNRLIDTFHLDPRVFLISEFYTAFAIKSKIEFTAQTVAHNAIADGSR